MNECQAIALQPLQDESLAAKQSRADAFGKGDLYFHASGGAEKSILLAQKAAADRSEIEGDDLARIRRAKSHMSLAAAVIKKGGDKKRLAGDHSLKALEQSAAGAGLHFDAIFHIHHGACLGAHAFAGIELYLDELHIIAINFVIQNISH